MHQGDLTKYGEMVSLAPAVHTADASVRLT